MCINLFAQITQFAADRARQTHRGHGNNRKQDWLVG